MRICFLGPTDSNILRYLRSVDDVVSFNQDKLAGPPDSDFIVSHGYRHIVRPGVLAEFPKRAVNCHISFLPWNRGAHPNVWSWVDHTEKGVTIHHMDEGIDTGDIIAQSRVRFGPNETLRSSYDLLQGAITALFCRMWPAIRALEAPSIKQPQEGTFNKASDLEMLRKYLTDGWDTPVSVLEEVGAEIRLPSVFS